MRIVATLLVALVSMSSASGDAQDDLALRAGWIHTPTTRFALESAARGARDRLEREECRQVLSDFRDSAGVTVEERLEALGETPRSYLATITFHEGLDTRRCKDAATLAFSIVGNRHVYLCAPQFWQAYRSNPSRVETTLIHEMMHTLGLGENPPTPMEIDARVLKRCR